MSSVDPIDPMGQLESVLLEVSGLAQADLRTRLHWIERAAAAAEAANLDEEGAMAALHLRAALGAIVKWSQGPKDPATLVELDAVVRTLLARGQLGLLRSLAAGYDQLVVGRAPHRAACAEARDALRELARAIEKGEPPPASARERFESIRASLPKQS